MLKRVDSNRRGARESRPADDVRREADKKGIIKQRRRGAAIAVGLASLVALAGCGTREESPEDQVVAVIQEYVSALLEKDPAGVCAVLAPEEQKRLITEVASLKKNRECEEAALVAIDVVVVDELQAIRDEVGPRDVDIDGSRAVVAYPGGERQPLTREDDEWLISGEAE